MPSFRPPPLLQLAAAQALMMSVSSLLLASSARIGLQLGSPGLATLPLALQSLATLLTLPLAARLGLRHGRAMLFLGGAGLGALGLGLAALALMLHSLGLFLVASGLLGVFIGVGQGYRFAAAERVAPAQRNRALALTLLGGVLAAWDGPWLAAWSAGQDLPFLYGYGLLLPPVLLLGLALGRLDFQPAGGAPAAASARLRPAHPLGPVLLLGIGGYGLMGLLMNATPIAMLCAGHQDFGLTARVIQWHVVAMYAPSLITGRLIDRWGAWPVLLAGALLNGAAMGVNLEGSTLPAFELALTLLGLGWNLLYVGASSLIGQHPDAPRRARLQAWHDMGCFGLMGLVTLGAAPLVDAWGWARLNQLALPGAGLLALVAAWQWARQWQEARPGRLKTGQTG